MRSLNIKLQLGNKINAAEHGPRQKGNVLQHAQLLIRLTLDVKFVIIVSQTVSVAESPRFKIPMTSNSINTEELLATASNRERSRTRRELYMDQSLLSDSKMDSKKLNKIGEIIKLQRILKKKCRKLADSFEHNNNSNTSNSSKGSNKRIKFLKRTLSFTDNSSISGASRSSTVPKGYFAICVGKDMKKFVIPTEYLCHKAFEILLREAEEEFGFQQEGVLRLPCEEGVFQETLKVIQKQPDALLMHQSRTAESNGNRSCSLESQLLQPPHAQIQPCR